MDEDDLGEDIWNMLSWRSGITGKIRITREYFEGLSFPECQRNVIDFMEAYFVAYCDEEESNKASGLSVELRHGDVLQALSEEFFFGCLDDADFNSVQELRLLELVCGYFEGEKTDPVRFFVFDSLFGNLAGEDIKDVLREIKINFLGKLLSMAVAIKCKLILEYSAALFQSAEFWEKGLPIIANIINDFCYIVPSAFQILKEVINISPSFAYELIDAAPLLYSFNEKTKKDSNDDDNYLIRRGLPPIPLIMVIGSWLTDNPNFGVTQETHPFFSLPSIYSTEERKPKVYNCLVTGLMHWSVLSPLFAGVKTASPIKGQIHYSAKGGSTLDATKIRNASSQLHYGILNFFAIQRRVESSNLGDDDDLEPGEVAELAKQLNLINENDIKQVIASLDETVENLKDDITEEKLRESIDRLAQLIQVSKWSGCLAPTSKKFKHSLKKLPKTKLFSKVLKNL